MPSYTKFNLIFGDQKFGPEYPILLVTRVLDICNLIYGCPKVDCWIFIILLKGVCNFTTFWIFIIQLIVGFKSSIINLKCQIL